MVNYSELIKEVATKLEFTQKDTRAVMDTLIATVEEKVLNGEDVKLQGLCTIKVVDVPEKTGIIQLGVRKGETYTTPAHKDVKIKAVPALRDKMKEA